jgi:hypothetical protein
VGANILYADERLALATCSGVFLSVLRLPLNLQGAIHLRREAKTFNDRSAGRSGSLAIIEATASANPPSDVREHTAAMTRENKIIAAAITLEGSGFRPAAIRTMIAGLYLVARKEYPHKIFERASDAAEWLAPLMSKSGVQTGSAELYAAVEELRRAIKP